MGASGSIGKLTVINGVSAAVAVVNSVVIARLFGTGVEIAVYFGASTLVGLMFSLTQAGQLGEIFLPEYVRLKEQHDVRTAARAFSVLLNWIALALAAMSVLLFVLTPLLIRLLLPGFDATDQELGTAIFLFLIPLVPLQVVFALIQTVANAERLFGLPELLGVIGRLVVVIAIPLLAPRFGIWGLVYASWIGFGIQIIGYAVMLTRMGYRHALIWSTNDFDHWRLFRMMGHSFAYVGSTQIWGFAFTAALSSLPTSVFAVFKYVQQLYAKTNGVFMRPIGIVFFTGFSEAAARSVSKVRKLGRDALDLALVIAAFAVVTIAVSGRPLLSALWGGEKFDVVQIELAAELLTLLFGLLAFSVVGSLARKAAISLGQIRAQYIGAAMVQLMSAALAQPVIAYGGVYGAVGIVAFNTIGLGVVPVVLVRATLGWTMFYQWRKLLLWIFAGAVVVVCVYQILALNPGGTLIVGGKIGEFFWAAVLAVLAGSMLALVSTLLGAREVERILSSILQKRSSATSAS